MKYFFPLKTKLTIYTLSLIVASLVTIGLMSDRYLHQYFYKDAKDQLKEAFFVLSTHLKTMEKDLLETLYFISQDDAVIASLNLIKNYEDVDNYSAIIFDEEKKRILRSLREEGKYSANDHIAIYDSKKRLVAYTDREEQHNHDGYVSYEKGKAVYYSNRADSDSDRYKRSSIPEDVDVFLEVPERLGPYELQSGGVIYQKRDGELNLHVERAILRKISKNEHSVVGYIETHNRITGKEVDLFANKKHIVLDYHVEDSIKKYLDDRSKIEMQVYDDTPLLFSAYESEELHLTYNEDYFYTGIRVPLEEGSLLITAKMQKAKLSDALLESRKTLLMTLTLIALITLIVSYFILNRMISVPLKNLLEGIGVISRGDYSHQIRQKSMDELGLISMEFNEMASKISKRERELDELAHHDALTQMPNRMMFQKGLDAAISRAARLNSKLAVFFLDLDDFKVINDTLGHDVGDKLLVEVSKRLFTVMRNNDLLARIGGDEFNILVEDLESEIVAEEIAQKIINEMKMFFEVDGEKMYITCSIGISIYPNDGKESVSLLKDADLAMYHAKESGRNRYHFFSKELEASLKQRTLILKELKRALVKNEFKLFYQPKFSFKDGSVCAAEALIRWENKKLGLMMPSQFISLAEESGKIIEIGAWVINQACKDFALWKKMGLDIEQVSVNVSNVQFAKDNIPMVIQKALKKTKIPAQSLEIEMTESYIHDNSNNAINVLKEIRALGVDLAIDDFGTGYSSMSYLKRLPLSRLKIDKSFIDDIPYDSDDVEITKIIIALAKVMRLSITAEGVETIEQMQFLKELECDEGQGYFCSKPLPVKKFIALLQSNVPVRCST